MNQTDLQGETERALRAITCPDGCGKNLSTVCNGVKPGMWHLTLTNSWLPCTYNPKLLPLFQQSVAGAYAAAAKLCERHADAEEARGPIHPALVSDVDEYFRWMRTYIFQFRSMAKAILALTPADARQAQTAHDKEIIELEIAHANKRVEAEADYWKRNHTAAIASAEARGRDDAVNMCVAAVMLAHSRNTSNENWATRAINCIRATEAAARTPHSTCPTCHGERVIESKPAGAGHSDDLAEHVPCPDCTITSDSTKEQG